MSDYIHTLIEGAKPIWAAVIAALCYVLFPDVAFQTALGAVGLVIVLDILTKLWALSVQSGGYIEATCRRRIWSKTLWEGTKVKLYAYSVVFILAGLSYRVAPLAQASVFLATVVYSIVFLRETQSILENMCDAGADLGWLLVFVKKKQRDLLEQQLDDGYRENEGGRFLEDC
jgi:Ni,Fe-hydrogenase I cytochrome b subunit